MMPRLLSFLVFLALTTAGFTVRANGAQPESQDLELEITWCDESTSDAPLNEQDCVQSSGAAIGEIDPLWRKRMPPKVRWITSKNAVSSCSAAEGPYGKMVTLVGDRGCVWLSVDTCTILTAVYIAHVEIGNALKSCAVK